MPTLRNAGVSRDKQTLKSSVYMFINNIHISDV